MKDRLLTLGLALAAFAAFYALMAPKPDGPQEHATRPTTIESGQNGYLGLMRWFEAERVPVVSLRERFTKLAGLPEAPAKTGNLLVTTAPHLYPMRDSEAQPLQQWINQGNTLLVIAALSDTPEWSMGQGFDPTFMARLKTMTGLSFEQISTKKPTQTPPESEAPKDEAATDDKPADDPGLTFDEALDAAVLLTTPQRFESKSAGVHPLLDGVTTINTLSDYPTAKWRGGVVGGLALELAHEPDSGAPVLWMLPSGNGRIIVCAYGNAFTNRVIGKDDNARLLANIVRWSVRDQGKVIIDDAHQGLVAFYDPTKFFGDRRLHITLWWLIGLWLIFVLGAQRLRPAVSKWNPIDITGFVKATGGFMARVLRPATVGEQMFVNFFNDTRRQIGLPLNGAPVWDWLRAHAPVQEQDIDRLQELHTKVSQGRRIDLPKLHNLLTQTRAALK